MATPFTQSEKRLVRAFISRMSVIPTTPSIDSIMIDMPAPK
jgi:hypothetical protein